VSAAQVDDAIFEGKVVAVNRGGAICLVEGLRAFLPGSHLVNITPTDDLVGQSLSLKFLEVDKELNKLVVSNRRANVEQQMTNLSKGDIVVGHVKALKPYGAFVDVGGMSGLLHISQISYDRITDLTTVFQPGDPVKCMIIDHDKVNGRIALSTKTLEAEPGDMMKDKDKVFEFADEAAAKYMARMKRDGGDANVKEKKPWTDPVTGITEVRKPRVENNMDENNKSAAAAEKEKAKAAGTAVVINPSPSVRVASLEESSASVVAANVAASLSSIKMAADAAVATAWEKEGIWTTKEHPEALAGKEGKHVPTFKRSAVLRNSVVTVSLPNHPTKAMDADHFIEAVWVRNVKTNLLLGFAKGSSAALDLGESAVGDGSEIAAFAKFNTHGTWKSDYD
jgi:predicted RNA-binding protein with RPS1 domain/desulfoferrodoxin (superoxide reductase-like protein)